MTVLLELLVLLFRAFVPAAVEATRDTAEDGDPNVELRDRLRGRVQATWGRHLMIILGLSFLYIGAGCGTRSIYVPDGTPVRIREEIRSAKVWVLDAEGNPVPSVMDLPAGWFALPPTPKE